MSYTKEAQQQYVFHFSDYASMAAYPFVREDLGALCYTDDTGNSYQVNGAGIGAVTAWNIGCIRQKPTEVALAANVATLDCSQNNSFQLTAILTANFSVVLQNFKDGDAITLAFKQAAAGGMKITAVTAAARNKEMSDELTTINTPNMLVANAKCVLTALFFTAGGDAMVRAWMNTGTALAVT